jgi:cobalt transporter subunit CbtB
MSIRTPSATADAGRFKLARVAALWPALAAAALGLAIVYVVGFAGAHTIHEAAHDARHSLNFPCH